MSLSQTQIDLITEGFKAGQLAERKRIDALLETLPAQFNHQDHATRAIAKARQLIARTHENSAISSKGQPLIPEIGANARKGEQK